FLDTVNHEFLMSLHKLQWNQVHKLNDFFILHKMLKDYNHFIPEKQYHVIYFDAFAPEKQPEMWNEQNFKKLFYALQTNGLMVTYCAKGEIKRRLKKIGFTVKLVEGPPGKHEMIRAVKPG
ncbi:MAG: MnmC family methyltransferase, partial [Bacteroidota bacterium]